MKILPIGLTSGTCDAVAELERQLLLAAVRSTAGPLFVPGHGSRIERSDFVVAGEGRAALHLTQPKDLPASSGLDRIKVDVVMQVASSATCD